MNTHKGWSVQSNNFEWHEPISATDYANALRVASDRGWDAVIRFDDKLVATWSALYGTRIYDRALAALVTSRSGVQIPWVASRRALGDTTP
jgi:hypothetical protein